MKTIGLIGGMSWESSIEYYRIINQQVRKELGGAQRVVETDGSWKQANHLGES